MKQRFVVLLLALLLSFTLAAQAAGTVETLYPEGMAFDQEDAWTMEAMLNELRTDSSKAWYFDESGAKVSVSGLSKLVWDEALEKTAQQRAEECAYHYSTTRPNLSDSVTAFPAGYEDCKEIISAYYSTAAKMFDNWAAESGDYSSQSCRRVMLSDKYDSFAVGHAVYQGNHYWSLCLAHAPAASAANRSPITYGFPIEVSSELVKSRFLQSPEKFVKIGAREELILCFTTTSAWPSYIPFVYKPYTGVQWTSSDTGKIAVEYDEAHKTAYAKGVSVGKATLSATVFGKTVKATITVIETDRVTVNGGVYDLNHAKQTAELVKPEKTSVKTLKIPDTVKANGITYKVASIAASACKGLKKLTAVTISKNISSIGAEAFSGCKALKTVTIKTTKLKSSTVGANAFNGIYKKATIKCPAKKLSAYKKLLLKKGVPATAKFTK